MPPLLLSHLSKTYRRRNARIVALDDLTLDVRDGELLVLVGPSGCGKTTTLRLVAGLEQPDHQNGHGGGPAQIRLGNRDLGGVKPEDRDVAMVFQHGALYPHLTAAENIGFPLEMRRVPAPERRRRVQETAALLEIDAVLSRRPHELSGGERQRVAVGRAIVRDPAILLLDEPFAALDPPLRARLRSELRALHARLGTTAIHVTHDQEDAMALGARVAVLRHGRLHQIGTPEEIYSSPCNRFVASFVGMPPMNLIDGRMDSSEATPRFVASELALELPAALRSLGSRDCACGVRATDVHPVAATAAAQLEGEVHQCEPLGDRVDVTLRLPGGHRFVARVPSAERPALGDRLRLRVSRLHLFEAGAEGTALAHEIAAP